MPLFQVMYSVCYPGIGDSRCDPSRHYTSVQYFDADSLDNGVEVARRLRRELKNDCFAYSVTLESLVEVDAVA